MKKGGRGIIRHVAFLYRGEVGGKHGYRVRGWGGEDEGERGREELAEKKGVCCNYIFMTISRLNIRHM